MTILGTCCKNDLNYKIISFLCTENIVFRLFVLNWLNLFKLFLGLLVFVKILSFWLWCIQNLGLHHLLENLKNFYYTDVLFFRLSQRRTGLKAWQRSKIREPLALRASNLEAKPIRCLPDFHSLLLTEVVEKALACCPAPAWPALGPPKTSDLTHKDLRLMEREKECLSTTCPSPVNETAWFVFLFFFCSLPVTVLPYLDLCRESVSMCFKVNQVFYIQATSTKQIYRNFIAA